MSGLVSEPGSAGKARDQGTATETEGRAEGPPASGQGGLTGEASLEPEPGGQPRKGTGHPSEGRAARQTRGTKSNSNSR